MSNQFLDNTSFVYLRIRQWSGTKKLDREESGLSDKLTDKVVSTGIKRLVDPADLKVFDKLKKRAERTLMEEGIAMMGGFAVKDKTFDEQMKKIAEIRRQYFVERDKFLDTYQASNDRWLKENPDAAIILRNALPSRERVKQSFGFETETWKLTPSHNNDANDDVFADMVLGEVSQMASRIWKNSVCGKDISQRLLSGGLTDIYKKLDALCFGNGKILNLLKQYETLQSRFPATGGIAMNESLYLDVSHFLLLLCDPENAEQVMSTNTTIVQAVQQPLTTVVNSIPLSQPKQQVANSFYF